MIQVGISDETLQININLRRWTRSGPRWTGVSFRAGDNASASDRATRAAPASLNIIHFIMDSDRLMSSPVPPRSSLPPSSAPLPTQSSSHHDTPRRARQTADPLTFADDEAEEAREENGLSQRRRRVRGQQINGDVPMVKDAVGESVAEAFEAFLKS